jgi:type II secretory pathway pseudopilin PulG
MKTKHHNKLRFCAGMTMLEIVIALALMVVVFSAVLPQFKNIQNTWAAREGNAVVIQNGRVLIDYLNRRLSEARKITAVSADSDIEGFIEFEDNTGSVMRFDVGPNGYVRYGPVDSLSDLAGPVNRLQFTCYDAYDLDTPTIETGYVRNITVEATFLNPAPLGQNRTFTTSTYLYSNWYDSDFMLNEPFEYDDVKAKSPFLIDMTGNRYLCAYTGNGDDGWAVVLITDPSTWEVTMSTPFEFDTLKGKEPVLSKIDNKHYLCAYAGDSDDGWAVVLTISPGSWTISKETPFEFETVKGKEPVLSKIDDEHYLCAYKGDTDKGWAVVLTVDNSTWNITKETPFKFDTVKCKTPALSKIDDEHYLCVYAGDGDDGWAKVLTVDNSTWDITVESALEFDTLKGKTASLSKIDNEHYLCAYSGDHDHGWAVVLTVDNGTWNITKETPFEFETKKGKTPVLAQINYLPPGISNRIDFLCVYAGDKDHGYVTTLKVNESNWEITKGNPLDYEDTDGDEFMFEDDKAKSPVLCTIDNTRFLCAISGGPPVRRIKGQKRKKGGHSKDHGWALVFDVAAPLEP